MSRPDRKISLELKVIKELKSANFSAFLNLPNGFYLEGIVLGNGNDLYAGSLYHGGIYKIDLRTGSGAMLVPAQSDGIASGLDIGVLLHLRNPSISLTPLFNDTF